MKPEGDLVRVESNKYIDLSQIKLNKNGTKNWMGSMGTHLDFIYEDIQGTLILEEYEREEYRRQEYENLASK